MCRQLGKAIANKINKNIRLYLFGGDDELILSFTLPIGHYQLLFENRFFTREKIEAEPIFDCEDIDYDDYNYQL